jgi:hypothetical protein
MGPRRGWLSWREVRAHVLGALLAALAWTVLAIVWNYALDPPVHRSELERLKNPPAPHR